MGAHSQSSFAGRSWLTWVDRFTHHNQQQQRGHQQLQLPPNVQQKRQHPHAPLLVAVEKYDSSQNTNDTLRLAVCFVACAPRVPHREKRTACSRPSSFLTDLPTAWPGQLSKRIRPSSITRASNNPNGLDLDRKPTEKDAATYIKCTQRLPDDLHVVRNHSKDFSLKSFLANHVSKRIKRWGTALATNEPNRFHTRYDVSGLYFCAFWFCRLDDSSQRPARRQRDASTV